MAQWLADWYSNQDVGGSNPAWRKAIFHFPHFVRFQVSFIIILSVIKVSSSLLNMSKFKKGFMIIEWVLNFFWQIIFFLSQNISMKDNFLLLNTFVFIPYFLWLSNRLCWYTLLQIWTWEMRYMSQIFDESEMLMPTTKFIVIFSNFSRSGHEKQGTCPRSFKSRRCGCQKWAS